MKPRLLDVCGAQQRHVIVEIGLVCEAHGRLSTIFPIEGDGHELDVTVFFERGGKVLPQLFLAGRAP